MDGRKAAHAVAIYKGRLVDQLGHSSHGSANQGVGIWTAHAIRAPVMRQVGRDDLTRPASREEEVRRVLRRSRGDAMKEDNGWTRPTSLCHKGVHAPGGRRHPPTPKSRDSKGAVADSKARREERLREARKLARIEAELAESSRRLEALEKYLAANARESCPICFESIVPEGQPAQEGEVSEELKVLGCAHTFHLRCISPWLAKKRSCPLCRAPIDDVIRVYE